MMTRYVHNYCVFIKKIDYVVAVFIRWHAIVSNNDADEHHTVWLQLQAIWGGKQCWVFICLVSCTTSWIGNDTIHGIHAVWNTSRSWTYKHSDHQSCFMIRLSTYYCIVHLTIIDDIRKVCIIFTYSSCLEMVFYVGVIFLFWFLWCFDIVCITFRNVCHNASLYSRHVLSRSCWSNIV